MIKNTRADQTPTLVYIYRVAMTLSLCFIVKKLDKWMFVYDGLHQYRVAKNTSLSASLSFFLSRFPSLPPVVFPK